MSRSSPFPLNAESSFVSHLPQQIEELWETYTAGPALLRESVRGLTAEQVRTPAPPGRWSPLEVVCHIADFERVYADRMKRVVAEERPTLLNGDPDLFAAKLAYGQRDLEEELAVIESVRRQVARFLRTLDATAFEREAIHSTDGPISLTTLLKRMAGHIPRHVEFIRQKRQNAGQC